MAESPKDPEKKGKKAEKAEDSNVVVALRLRPPEYSEGDFQDIYETDETSITTRDPLCHGREHNFSFDRVFLPECGQDLVFRSVAQPLIDHLLVGFNSCCFAYGQTGSGKTYSVFGEGNEDNRGMLARSIEYLFEKIERQAFAKEVGMVVSFSEIYLDQVRDLGRAYTATRRELGGSSKKAGHEYLKQDLAIHESPQGMVYVEDLSLIPVSNIREVLDIANLGVQMRETHETRLNATSSRSHSIFTVSIVQKARNNQKGGTVESMINFVDLAGSERLARSQSEGKRFQEAVVINSSLSALGKVVLALAATNARHIPYRDTKLTRILQNSLGGNAYTTLLCCIDPSPVNYEESLNSLSFADRCLNVQNRPTVNYVDDAHADPNEKLVVKLQEDIERLKNQIELQVAIQSMSDPSFGGGMGPLGAGGGAHHHHAMGAAGAHAHHADGALTAEHAGGAHAAIAALLPAGVHEAHAELIAAAVKAGIPADPRHLQLMIQAKERLDTERELAEAAETKVQEALSKLEDVRLEHVEKEERRREESTTLRQINRQLKVEIAKFRCSLAHATVGGAALERSNQIRALDEHADHVVRQHQEMLRLVPPQLTAEVSEAQAAAEADRRLQSKEAEAGERSAMDAKAMQRGHDRDCHHLEWQHEQWQSKRGAAGKGMVEELEQYLANCQRLQQQMHGELISAYDLEQQLSQLADSLVTGVPSTYRSGVRPPGPDRASALRAKLQAESSLPDRALDPLRRDLSDVKRLASKLRRFSDADALGGWNAQEFARNFCKLRAARGGGACDPLRTLTALQLKVLCMALRGRQRMQASDQEVEKKRVREEVAKELMGHMRIEKIRQLEREIMNYQVKLRSEEERARQLDSALQSCARAERNTQCRPPSAVTRPGSAVTRPASAAHERPTSAGGLRRPASALSRPASATSAGYI